MAPRGAFGLAAALFPVADGGNAEAVSAGEDVLGRAAPLADGADIDRGGHMGDEPSASDGETFPALAPRPIPS